MIRIKRFSSKKLLLPLVKSLNMYCITVGRISVRPRFLKICIIRFNIILKYSSPRGKTIRNHTIKT